MKKLISALVVAAQVFTLSVVPSITAQAEATTNLGLVYYQEAETATDWTVTRGSAAAEADADGFIKYTPNRTHNWGSGILMQLDIPLSKPIAFEDGKVIVIETALKATSTDASTGRFGFGWNERGTGTVAAKDGAEQAAKITTNHNVLFVLASLGSGFSMGYNNGKALDVQSQVSWATEDPVTQNKLTGTEIYKSVLKINKIDHTVTTELWQKGSEGFTKIISKENTDLGYVTKQDNLNALWFTEHANPMVNWSVDYVKVYNMPEAEVDNYATAAWQNEFVKVESEIQGGEVIADVLTYTKDESFDVKFNAEMDTDSITGTSMYIVAEGETDPVDAMVLYNETTKTATITPDPRLETGDYTLVLENTITTEAVYPAVAESLKFAGAEYDFHYNATGVPVASLPKIVHDGDKMKATFTYNHEDGIEPGTHTYQWKMSATEGGTYNPIDDATAEELLYTADMNGKWFKVEITPYDDNGLDGAMVTTPAFQGPVAPVATEYEITGTPVAGKELTAKVKWADANPYDAEGVHNYQWLVNSLEAADTFTEIGGATEKTYVIPEGSAGLKYKVKIQPVSVNAPFEGEWVTTGATAAVTDIKSATNMISNSGFESGNVSPWTQGTNGGTQVLETVDKDDEPDNVYEGEKSLHYSTSVGYQSHGFTVTVQKEKIYLVQAAIKAAGASAITSVGWRFWGRTTTGDAFAYNATLGTDALYKDVMTGSGSNIAIAPAWNVYEEAFATYKNATDKIQFYSNSAYGFYLDNLYFAELIVSGVNGVNVPATVQIPEYGKTTKVSLGTPSLVNQLGSQTGLDYAKATVRVKGTNEAAEVIQENGIYYLVLNDKAVVGDLEIEAGFVAAENHRMYKNVADYLETYTISLTGTGNKTPMIRDTSIAGTVNENDVIEMDYVFYQEDGDADLSVITWYYKSTPEGTFEVIPGETSKDYQVTAATANGYFRASVLPKTATAEGTLVYTEEVGAPTAPSAKNVAIAGDPFIGETLTGSYDFYDYNKDAEGATTFRWLRAATADGAYTPIGGATATTYVLTEDDIDMFLKFEVTPIAEVGPQPAEGTKSAAAFAGPALPTAENVKITKSGSALLGSYDYKGNAPEGKSLYRWIVDGTVVSTTASYIPAFRGTKLVTFEVTPVASKEPSVGEAVAVSLNIQGGSSGSTGGTSGPSFIGTAGGGTMNQAPVTSITQPEVEVDNSPSSKVTDIETHWGYDAIKWALDNEIMESATDTTFDPNALVSRENVIRYLAKLAGFEPTESKGIFADVEGEFADILQTFVDKGIISVDENFRPADSLSRQELCKIFALTLGLTSENAETTSFADNDAIGTWAVPHVNAMTEAGFIKGVGANSFSPQGDLTKAQMATLLQRAQATLGE